MLAILIVKFGSYFAVEMHLVYFTDQKTGFCSWVLTGWRECAVIPSPPYPEHAHTGMHLVHVFSCRSGLFPICKFSRGTIDPTVLKTGPGIISKMITPHQQGNIFAKGPYTLRGPQELIPREYIQERVVSSEPGKKLTPCSLSWEKVSLAKAELRYLFIFRTCLCNMVFIGKRKLHIHAYPSWPQIAISRALIPQFRDNEELCPSLVADQTSWCCLTKLLLLLL